MANLRCEHIWRLLWVRSRTYKPSESDEVNISHALNRSFGQGMNTLFMILFPPRLRFFMQLLLQNPVVRTILHLEDCGDRLG